MICSYFRKIWTAVIFVSLLFIAFLLLLLLHLLLRLLYIWLFDVSMLSSSTSFSSSSFIHSTLHNTINNNEGCDERISEACSLTFTRERGTSRSRVRVTEGKKILQLEYSFVWLNMSRDSFWSDREKPSSVGRSTIHQKKSKWFSLSHRAEENVENKWHLRSNTIDAELIRSRLPVFRWLNQWQWCLLINNETQGTRTMKQTRTTHV